MFKIRFVTCHDIHLICADRNRTPDLSISSYLILPLNQGCYYITTFVGKMYSCQLIIAFHLLMNYNIPLLHFQTLILCPTFGHRAISNVKSLGTQISFITRAFISTSKFDAQLLELIAKCDCIFYTIAI